MVHSLGTRLINRKKEENKGFELTGEWAGVCVIQLPTNYTLQLGDVIDPRYILHQEQEWNWQPEYMQNPIVEDEPTQEQINEDINTTLREYSRAFRNNPSYIPFNQEYDNINSNKEVEQHRERKCWVCNKQLDFQEYLKQNIIIRGTKEERTKCFDILEKQWESNKVEIACCSCYTIIQDVLKFKQINSITSTLRSSKIWGNDTIIINKSKPYKINITGLDKNNEYIELRLDIKQFKALLDKKVIEVPEEVVRELLGGAE